MRCHPWQRSLLAASPSVLSIAPRRPSSAHGRDFVVENIIDSRARAAAASAARLQRDLRQQEEEERWRSKPTYGKVPRYLQDVKVQLARRHADEQVRCRALRERGICGLTYSM